MNWITRHAKTLRTIAVSLIFFALVSRFIIYPRHVHSLMQSVFFLCFFPGILLYFICFDRNQPATDYSESVGRTRRALAFILISGFAVRAIGLEWMPPGLWLDEAHNGLDAIRAIEAGRFPIYYPANTGREPLFLWIVAISVKFFENTIFALRLPAAISGTFLIFIIYLATRRIFDHRTALFAAGFTAFSRWPLTFSRLSFRSLLMPVMGTLFVYFLIKYATKKPMIGAGLTGLAMGVGFYSAIPFRIFPLFAAAAWLIVFWNSNEKMRAIASFGVFLAVSLIVVSPMIAYFSQHPAQFFARIETTSILDGSVNGFLNAAGNFRDLLLMFHYRGDSILRHNIPGYPLADPIIGFLMIAGIASAGLRSKASWMLWSWILILMIPSAAAVTWTGPHALRSLGIAPPVMIFAAVGANEILRRLRNRRSVQMFGALILVSAAVNFYLYFGVHRQAILAAKPDIDAVWGFNIRETRLANELTELVPIEEDSKSTIYCSPQLYFQPSLQYLTYSKWRLELIESPRFFDDLQESAKTPAGLIDPVQRNLFWLRNDDSKRFFDFWMATYGLNEIRIEHALESCYIKRTGLNNTGDNLIRAALIDRFPTAHPRISNGFEVWKLEETP